MSLESATYINGLVTTNPTSTDPKSEGDDHLRLIKSTIKNTFPNVTAAVNSTQVTLNNLDAQFGTRKLLFGNIFDSGGIQYSSGGFTVTKGATGIYTINFTVAFSIYPSVTATSLYTNRQIFVNSLSTTSCRIDVTDLSGTYADATFCFQAMGNL